MKRIMMTTIAAGVSFLLSCSMMCAAGLSGPDKKQRKQDILRLIELTNNRQRSAVLQMLMNDEACFSYCMDAYHKKEADFANDTAKILNVYRQNDWIIRMCESISEKEVKKYQLEDWQYIIQTALMENNSTRDRFDAVLKYYDRIFTMRREAEARTMPKGKMTYFRYEEYGSSRPDPVYYEIKVDSATGKATLYGPENDRIRREIGERLTVALDETAIDTIRQIVEKEKIYQKLSYYSRPHIPRVPEITGGPPSWNFTYQTADGRISTGGNQVSPPKGCIDIANYLNVFLRKEWERRMEAKGYQ